MSVVLYRIKANNGFVDGNIFPRRIHVGEILVVDEPTFKKMRFSDPDSIELIEKVVPNPTKKAKAANA